MSVCNYISCQNPARYEDELGDPVCAAHKDWRSCAICEDKALERDQDGWDYCPLHVQTF